MMSSENGQNESADAQEGTTPVECRTCLGECMLCMWCNQALSACECAGMESASEGDSYDCPDCGGCGEAVS